MNAKILILDDSKTINAALSSKLAREVNMETLSGHTMEECVQHIDAHQNEIALAIACMYLPGSNEGEAIDYLIKKDIPTVVLTGNFDENIRKSLFEKQVSDYYLKANIRSLDHAVEGVKRLLQNRGAHVIVEDMNLRRREVIKHLLQHQLLKVSCSENLEMTQSILQSQNDVRMLITTQQQGIETLKTLRETYSKDKLSIIIIAEAHEKNMVAPCIKYGANDYLQRPYCNEEFLSKIGSQLEILHLFEIAVSRANRDFMTGMYNRRYFFDEGMSQYNKARESGKNLAVAMIDIDKFKRINDTYGHDIGDIAIKEVATILTLHLNEFGAIISRFGGEEFCMIITGIAPEHVIAKFETIRQAFEANIIEEGAISFSYTVSTGLHFPQNITLDDAVKKADENLYAAKEGGRNRVIHN